MKAKKWLVSMLTKAWFVFPVSSLIALGMTAAASTDDFHQDINYTLPLTADGSFSLDNVNGPITITGWDKNEVVVTGVKYGGSQAEVEAVKIEVDSHAARIVIHTRYPSDQNEDVKVKYTVQVPSQANLEKIADVNGAVHISGVRGDIAVSTVNGETGIKDAAGRLKLETVNGRISAEMVRLGKGQNASFNAVNGQIQVTLPPDANATVSAETVNGAITSDFTGLDVAREFPLGCHLKGRLGGGSARVHAETVNGAIHFEQGGKERAGDASSAGIRQGDVLKSGGRNSVNNTDPAKPCPDPGTRT